MALITSDCAPFPDLRGWLSRPWGKAGDGTYGQFPVLLNGTQTAARFPPCLLRSPRPLALRSGRALLLLCSSAPLLLARTGGSPFSPSAFSCTCVAGQHEKFFKKVDALGAGAPTTWTITRHGGPNHLRLWCDALPGHQMALITSDYAPPRLAAGGARPRLPQSDRGDDAAACCLLLAAAAAAAPRAPAAPQSDRGADAADLAPKLEAASSRLSPLVSVSSVPSLVSRLSHLSPPTRDTSCCRRHPTNVSQRRHPTDVPHFRLNPPPITSMISLGPRIQLGVPPSHPSFSSNSPPTKIPMTTVMSSSHVVMTSSLAMASSGDDALIARQMLTSSGDDDRRRADDRPHRADRRRQSWCVWSKHSNSGTPAAAAVAAR